MKYLNGPRFAADKNSETQAAIVFTHGAPSQVYLYGDLQDYAGQTLTLIDDEPLNGGVYTYQVEVDASGKATHIIPEVHEESAAPKIPAAFHPGQMASNARQEFIANAGMDPNAKPSNNSPSRDPFQDMFNTNRPSNQNKPKQQQSASGTNHKGQKTPPRKTASSFTEHDRKIESLLEQYGKDLTKRAAEGLIDPVIGRDEELDKVKQYSLRKKRSNTVLIGEAGVGKTAMFSALAQDIVDGNAEAELANARVIELDIQSMLAGSKFRGQFEERILPILKGLEERGGYLNDQKVILCIDEVHAVLNAGKTEGSAGAAQLMKPYLASDSLTVLAATTLDEYKDSIEKDPALDRRFQPLVIEEPSTEDTIKIINGLQKTFVEHHCLSTDYTEKQLENIVKLTDRFLPNRQQPDKAIGILDDAAAIARKEERDVVTDMDIIAATAKAANMDPDFLKQEGMEKYLTLEETIKDDVKGQDESVKQIADHLTAARMGLRDPDQPKGVFMLQGPTGVGKTFVTKKVAGAVNGNEDIIRIDMSKYKEKHAISGLIGSPPGFVGHDENNNAELTEPVRENPFAVVVFDEVEKAHPEVFDLLLSIMQDGELKDSKGRNVSFRNTVIFMTSNLGAEEIGRMLESGNTSGPAFDLSGTDEKAADKDMGDKIDQASRKAREKFFRPEFLNRVEMNGGCLTFKHLTQDVIHSLVVDEVKKVGERLATSADGLDLSNVSLEISDDVHEVLAEKGYNKKYGARPLTGAVQRELIQPLSRWLLENRDDIVKKASKSALKLVIDEVGDNFRMNVEEVTAPKEKVEEATPAATNDNADKKAQNKRTPKRRTPSAKK